MKHWMGPSDDFGEAEVTIDVRVGGRYRFIMHAPDGELHRVGGLFREIVPNRKLVYTWAWESTPERESLVTVEFKPSGQGTELLVTHQRFADVEARATSISMAGTAAWTAWAAFFPVNDVLDQLET